MERHLLELRKVLPCGMSERQRRYADGLLKEKTSVQVSVITAHGEWTVVRTFFCERMEDEAGNPVRTYDEVYENYSDKVMHYILSKISSRSDAEDLFSTVFLKVFEKFPSFDQNKASVSTWVYTIARNTLIDYFRVRKVHEELGEEDAVTEDAFAGILEEETLDELASALEKLPPRERDLIVLHYYHNLQLKEIAQIMGMSYSNCKVIHSKALARLRQHMTFDS